MKGLQRIITIKRDGLWQEGDYPLNGLLNDKRHPLKVFLFKVNYLENDCVLSIIKDSSVNVFASFNRLIMGNASCL